MSNDRYKKIRAALEMGPTPGPWYLDGEGIRALVRDANGVIVAARHRMPGHKNETNMRLIAACDPDTIRELLAERDALVAEVERLRADRGSREQQPAATSETVNVVGMREFDELMDHIYEYGTASEGVIERASAFARAVIARYAPQQPAAVDGAIDKARFERAPCYLCGYNGPGYYKPDTHPCAAKYHAAIAKAAGEVK